MGRYVLLFLTTVAAGPGFAQTKPLVRVGDGKSANYEGRVDSLDKTSVTMTQRDGRIVMLKRSVVKKVETVAKTFRPFAKSEVVSALREEFGSKFVVKTSQHYVVVVPKSSRTNYAAVFESVYGAFHYQFRRRKFHLQRTEFPLVAIVFSNFKDFARYAAKDGVRASPGLLGYYHRLSNRVAVYESNRTSLKTTPDTRSGFIADATKAVADILDTGANATLASTITHETIHQVSFNTGLHPRLGHAPRWLIEGLAMTFESPGFLSTKDARGSSRINRSRFVWFKNYQQRRRRKGSLKTFIESGSLFTTGTLDAYSQAWALTFFFMDQPARSYKFGQYVRAMNKRDLTQGYNAKERLRDFESAFGDIDRLEVQFLRFMDQLDPNSVTTR